MKKILLLSITVFLFSCTTKSTMPVEISADTLSICSEYIEKITALEAIVLNLQDSILHINSTIPIDIYMNARRIEKIKYYISITEKTPSNQKFFYGWIRRTMSEE